MVAQSSPSIKTLSHTSSDISIHDMYGYLFRRPSQLQFLDRIVSNEFILETRSTSVRFLPSRRFLVRHLGVVSQFLFSGCVAFDREAPVTVFSTSPFFTLADLEREFGD